MDKIEIKGYKSFRNLTLDLLPINILIGSNGSGKSNFLSFFEFLNRLYEQKLTEYVALNGGIDKYFFQGSKITDAICATIYFKDNFYSFELKEGDNRFVFSKEKLGNNSLYTAIGAFGNEASIKSYNGLSIGEHIRKYLPEIKNIISTTRAKALPSPKKAIL